MNSTPSTTPRAAWGQCYVKVGVQPERPLIHIRIEAFADDALKRRLWHEEKVATSVTETLWVIEQFFQDFGTWEEVHPHVSPTR